VAADSAGFWVDAGREERAGALGAGAALARSATLSDGAVVAAAVCWDSVGAGALGDVAARDTEEADGLDGEMTSGSIRGAPEGGSIRLGSGGGGVVLVVGCGLAWGAATTSAAARCQA
jgi:hypothetical protein